MTGFDDFPPGTVISLPHAAMLLDLEDGIDPRATVARPSQRGAAAEAAPGASQQVNKQHVRADMAMQGARAESTKAGSSSGPEAGGVSESGLTNNKRTSLTTNNHKSSVSSQTDKTHPSREPAANRMKAGISHGQGVGRVLSATSTTTTTTEITTSNDHGTVFWRFRHLPPETRSAVWLAAAEAARPRAGVLYEFDFEAVQLGSAPGHYALTRAMMDSHRRLSPTSPERLDTDLLRHAAARNDGTLVHTLTPRPGAGEPTRAARALLRSCPEARAGGGFFTFRWLVRARGALPLGRAGAVELGCVRPFSYDDDWLCLAGLHRLGYPRRLPGGGSDDASLWHLCSLDAARVRNVAFPYAAPYTDGTAAAAAAGPSLPSLPSHPPQRASGALTSRRLRAAMRRLREAILHLASLASEMRDEPHGAYPLPRVDLAALSFCLVVRAGSQEALDLLRFREDGSHLDGVGRVEDLGPLGQAVREIRRYR